MATEIASQGSKKSGVHEAVSRDLKSVGEALAAHPEWVSFFKSPVIGREARLETLNELWSKVGASEVTRKFFSQLVDNKQTAHVPELLEAYQQILRAKKGEVEATVVTAKPLTPKEVESVRAVIVSEFLGGATSANVLLTQQVDPALLGGLTLTVGSTYIDLSIKSRIDDIAQEYATVLSAARENAFQRHA